MTGKERVDADELATEIGYQLKRERGDQGLSQRDLCKKSDVSRAAISRVENGNAESKFETIVKITNALGVDFSDLVQAAEQEARRRAR